MPNPTPPTIEELFKSAAEQMRSDFEELRKSVPHHGESGEEAEEVVREFLKKHLPKRFSATTGFVIDQENKCTKQQDVLIYDAENSPIYRTGPKSQILPSDSIASGIEVKSCLDKDQLNDAVQKIANLKSLKKSPITDIDQPATFSDLIVNSNFGVVFGFDSRTSLESLAENLKEFNRSLPRSQWTDAVVVLGKGMINYSLQYPAESSLLGQLMPAATENIILAPYYVHLSVYEDAEYALNRFFSALMAQLTFFRKKSSLSLENMLQGSSKNVKTIQPYWFKTTGELEEVPTSQLGTGPGPLWEFDVFIEGTNDIIGRFYQFSWSDGFIYQVIPPLLRLFQYWILWPILLVQKKSGASVVLMV